jgi:hypothetical protein
MCRNMDINFYHKQHEKIRQQFRHDAIMRQIKKREDKLFRDMFIKIFLIVIIFVSLVYLMTR